MYVNIDLGLFAGLQNVEFQFFFGGGGWEEGVGGMTILRVWIFFVVIFAIGSRFLGGLFLGLLMNQLIFYDVVWTEN